MHVENQYYYYNIIPILFCSILFLIFIHTSNVEIGLFSMFAPEFQLREQHLCITNARCHTSLILLQPDHLPTDKEAFDFFTLQYDLIPEEQQVPTPQPQRAKRRTPATADAAEADEEAKETDDEDTKEEDKAITVS